MILFVGNIQNKLNLQRQNIDWWLPRVGAREMGSKHLTKRIFFNGEMKVDAAPRATEKWPIYASRPGATTIPTCFQVPLYKEGLPWQLSW